MSVFLPRGRHLLADFHGVAAGRLGDAVAIEALLRAAADAAGATPVAGHFHPFGPGLGVTGVLQHVQYLLHRGRRQLGVFGVVKREIGFAPATISREFHAGHISQHLSRHLRHAGGVVRPRGSIQLEEFLIWF